MIINSPKTEKDSISPVKLSWWTNARVQLNIGLLLGGLVTIGIIAAFALLMKRTSRECYELILLTSISYFIYLVSINLLFILLEIIQRLLPIAMAEENRQKHFDKFYRIVILIPIVYIAMVVLMAL